jgi:large conductance mechanosensitive channel
MSILKEFREFAIKGSVLDLAVGVFIGGAFAKIVSSLVSDVLMPTVGLLLGNIDFSTLSLSVGDATIAYGLFLQAVVDFVIVAFCIFLMIKQINRFRKTEAPAVPADIQLLTQIRDLLRKSAEHQAVADVLEADREPRLKGNLRELL